MFANFSTASLKISSFLSLALSMLSRAYLIAIAGGCYAIVAAVSDTGIIPANSCFVLVSKSNSPF